MNDGPVMNASEPPGRGHWLDTYMPDQQVAHYQPQPQQQMISLAVLRGILFRQRWLIGMIVAAAIVIGLVWTLLATPMYEARSSVRIQPGGSFIVEGQDIERGIPSNQIRELLATHVAVITSRNLANTVAEDLNLGERYDFLGSNIDESRPPNMTDEEWRLAKQSIAASILHGSVSAEIPQGNFVIQIAYHSEDPRIAAEMANAYAAAFAATETRESLENSEYAQDYLREQIELTRTRLQEAEQAANAYARESGIILQAMPGEDGESSVTLTSTNLANINSQFSVARAARIQAEQRWRSIQNLPPSQLSEVQSNSLLQGLIGQRTQKQAELANLRQRFLDAHPQVVSTLAQIETLDQQIEQTSADIKSAIRNEYVVARNQEEALQAQLGAATGDTLQEQDQQVEYSVLEREAQALRDQLQALLNRFNQVSTASTVQTGTIIPLDSAVQPGAPYAPSLVRNLAMALVFGVALAGAAAVLRETLDDRVRSLDDIEERLGLPLLGHTPYVDERDIEYEGSNRFSSLMEAYASIRSTIDFTMPRDRNVLQLTSSEESEGKSTTAVILAELFASLGRRTLLIDADLRRPSVASLLELERPKVGLVEVLLGHTDLQTALVSGVHENLDILPIGEIPTNPTELLASRQFRDFIARQRQEYSLVLFDSCPVLGLADAPMLAGLVDGTIFVMEANRASFSQVRSSIKRLRATGGNPIGAILTKYRALEAGEGYAYKKGYYQYGTTPKRG